MPPPHPELGHALGVQLNVGGASWVCVPNPGPWFPTPHLGKSGSEKSEGRGGVDSSPLPMLLPLGASVGPPASDPTRLPQSEALDPGGGWNCPLVFISSYVNMAGSCGAGTPRASLPPAPPWLGQPARARAANGMLGFMPGTSFPWLPLWRWPPF